MLIIFNKNLAALCPQKKMSLIDLVIFSTNPLAVKNVFMTFKSNMLHLNKKLSTWKVRGVAEKTAIKVA